MDSAFLEVVQSYGVQGLELAETWLM